MAVPMQAPVEAIHEDDGRGVVVLHHEHLHAFRRLVEVPHWEFLSWWFLSRQERLGELIGRRGRWSFVLSHVFCH